MAFDVQTLRSLRISLRAHLGHSTGSTTSEGEFDAFLAKTVDEVRATEFEHTIAGSARTIRSGRLDKKICTLVVTVSGVGHPDLILDGEEMTQVIRARVIDTQGDEVPLLPIVDLGLADALLTAGKRGASVRVAGIVLSVPKISSKHPRDARVNARVGVLAITSVENTYSHLDAMAASETEREQAADMISRARGGCVSFLREAITKQLNLVHIPRQQELLECVALQSLGCGDIGQTPGTIHILVEGPPGSGKKILSSGAELLHPRFEQVMPGRTSIAGLMGPSIRAPGGWTFEPGTLARATGGVTIIQDAHVWSAGELREHAPTLQHVIEDGQVRAAGMSRGGTSTARTSLLIDVNRTTDLLGNGRVAPILNEMPLLSRIDFLLRISSTATESWDVGAQLLSRHSLPTPELRGLRLAPAVVATLRDRHPVIDLGPVSALLKAGYETLYEDFEPFLQKHEQLASALSRRMAVSISKICAAATRGSDKSVAEEEHAQVALRAAREKLTFIRDHVVQLSKCPEGPPDVGQWLVEQTGTHTPESLAKHYREETGHTVSERTVRRRLVELDCKRAGKGQYQLPGTEEES